MTTEEFHAVRKDLPEQAGIYRYFDAAGNILYIGKAKDIRKRVSSYFLKSEHSLRLQRLVKQISRIEFTVVHTEQDAFLLENSLIKEFQPRYNILLKDDKTYPYICIRKEPFPRIMLTRQRANDGSEYLGPYTSVHSVKNILSLLFSIFPIRSCSLNLENEKILQKKFKICLEYHIKRCAGPCEGLQSEEEYLEGVQQIRNILKSDYDAVMAYLRKKMEELAGNLEFEKAAEFKEKLNLVSHYQSKNTVANPRLGNFMVLGMAGDDMA